jgi:integral membrane protein (TIGR00529 family)
MLVKYKVNIGISLIIGSMILGVFSLPVPDLIQVLFEAVVSTSTLELVATITSITFLNFAYQNTGKAQELGEILSNIFPSTSLLAIIPAIFGLLPVSGGALLSAPLVDLEGDKLGIEKGRKAFLNLWFRHIPHLIYPLETALVIVSYLTGQSLTAIILYQVPVFIVGLIVGYMVGLRGIEEKRKQFFFKGMYVKDLLVTLLPILLSIILIAIFGVKVFIAVFIGTVLLFVMTGIKMDEVVSSLDKVSKMVLVAFGIMIFRYVIDSSGAIDVVTVFLQTASIGRPVLLISLPIIIGFALGESTPAITISLSILLATYELSSPEASLVYACMYFGHLISPIHLCFAVTSEHLKTGTIQIYKRLIPATIATLSIAIPLMIFTM